LAYSKYFYTKILKYKNRNVIRIQLEIFIGKVQKRAAIVANISSVFSSTDTFPLNLNAFIKHFSSFYNVAETGEKLNLLLQSNQVIIVLILSPGLARHMWVPQASK
jgi:hypothetical protein